MTAAGRTGRGSVGGRAFAVDLDIRSVPVLCTAMANEIELKLELTPQTVEALDAAGFWPGEAVVAEQRSVYFDTPDHAIAASGMSLRIRRTGRKRVQTIKAEGASAGGLFRRSEWERSVRSDVPVIGDDTPLPAVLGGKIDTVDRLFEVAVQRQRWDVAEGDARIEMVLDRGLVSIGARQSPVSEIELELTAGPPAALFAYARRIDAVAPVRVGVQSKAERGYRLAGPLPSTFKAEPIDLHDDLTAADAIRRIVGNCVRHYRLNEARLLSGRDAAALHQARVALRRLRSALRIFRPIIAGAQEESLRAELRWLTAELGTARNLDVLLERSTGSALHARIVVARETAYDRVDNVLRSARARALMLDLTEWVATGDWLNATEATAARDRPVRAFAADALGRLRRRVKRRGRHLARADDETRHTVRKDAKKLRYGAEFFAGLYDTPRERRRHRKFVAALADLQDELGALNDLATAPQILAELGLTDEPDSAKLLKGGKRKALIAAAAETHGDLIDAKRFWRG